MPFNTFTWAGSGRWPTATRADGQLPLPDSIGPQNHGNSLAYFSHAHAFKSILSFVSIELDGEIAKAGVRLARLEVEPVVAEVPHVT